MEKGTVKKLLVTSILLIIIDRIEFAYYPFDGNGKYWEFPFYHKPMAESWFVQMMSIYFQQFLWTVILYLWIPMKKEMIFIMIAFFLCILEFPLTYGQPILTLPLPWQWFIPISCSLLRLIAILYFMGSLVMKIFKKE